ncbi:putative membrane protein C14C4.07 [Grifola frondosa]|uniref:Putative membrane protein C14C4.07 n=1 Tax=Grifola frondosa TaxID=5627 RepID=A0A1C7M6R8_GRIFR|nr:putative membrane protein C14C4.07 [Grifola frondosa]
MTLAPRVQVFTQLSCNAIYGHDIYDHTGSNTTLTPDYPHFPFHVGLVGRQLEILDLDLPASGEGSVYVATQSRHLNINHIDEEGDDDDDDDDDDPRLPPSKRCLQDSAVQAGAARIQTIMTVTMGTLSALTTGWWGHFGERHGRTRVLAAATFGLFLTDLTFILVLTGWLVDSTRSTSAYVSDCTSDGSRAHIFSRFTGVFYFGFAIGPTIGAFLIRHPFLPIFSSSSGSLHNGAPTVTSVFYIAAMASFVNMLLVLFLFPESLEKKKAKVSQQLQLAVSEESSPSSADRHSFLTDFLSPLALFLPRKIEVPGGTSRKDWSLTILAIALFGYLLSTGIFQIKYLYAQHVYGWGAEQLLHFIYGSRQGPPSVTDSSFVNTTRAVQPIKKGKRSPTVLAKEMRYDLLLIRASFIVDLLSHTLVSLSPADASQTLFVGFTVLSSFGAGIVPAANSLALCVMQSHGDGGIGKLFGAFAVLQAVGQMILGPMLFGLIFSETVAKFPRPSS